MNTWITTHLASDRGDSGPLTMGYYETEDIRFRRGLADAFTICDDYYCSILGPTDPNRVMGLSASIDPDGNQCGPCLDMLLTRRAAQQGRFTWKTMPEQLTEAGVSWKVYESANDTLLNPLLYFKNFTDRSALLGRNAHGDNSYPAAFHAEVDADTLPAVSWVFPNYLDSDHPARPPLRGEVFIARLLEKVVDNPAVWEKPAIVVTYDENGGFFDHGAPSTAGWCRR